MNKEYTQEQKYADAAELQFLIKSSLGDAGAGMSMSVIVGAVNGMRRQLMPLPGQDMSPVSDVELTDAFVASPRDVLMGQSIGKLVAMACRQGRMKVEGAENV